MNKISICVATRKRPDMFKKMCESVLSLADNPNEIEFLICRDKDDDSVYEYLGNYKVFVDDRTSVDFRLNEAWKSASGNIYGFNADDILFETKGWDSMVINKFNEYPDRIAYVYPNNHYSRSLFGIIGFVHKNWTDTVGYFIKPDFARRADCWLNDLSKIIGRKGHINSFGIKNIDIQDDEVHREYIEYADKTRNREKYHSKEMRNQRIKDAKKLSDFITAYTEGL